MFYISVLASPELGFRLADWTRELLAQRGLFPTVEAQSDLERFYYALRTAPPDLAVLALPGVAGLNEAEHLRALCPDCGLVWFSDLDFSLQAYRLRACYFALGPPGKEELEYGLARALEAQNAQTERRSML